MAPANHFFRAYEKTQRMASDRDFQVTVRRDKLLGYWVSDLLGWPPELAVAYGRAVAAADFEEPGDADVIRKVLADLTARGVWISEDEVREELDRLAERARREIDAETLASGRP
jgi:hypothetical protein